VTRPSGVSPVVGELVALARAIDLIAAIPDYPEPGVVFRDLTPLFADGAAFAAVVDALIRPFAKSGVRSRNTTPGSG
jgi:hypothetical protein